MRTLYRNAMILGAVALLGGGRPASAQSLAPSRPDDLARALQAHGIEPAIDFRMSRPINCLNGGAQNDWLYHCVAALIDGARGGRTAALEVMIYKGGYNFASMDAQVKAAVGRMGGRWKLDYNPEMTVDGGGRRISLRASCHQSRGQPNSPAYCMTPVSSNVTIFSQVAPDQSSSDRVTTSTNGGPDSFDDMARAGQLASLGAIAVIKAQQGAPPSERGFSDSIFKVQ